MIEENRKVEALQAQLYAGPAEEDIRPILWKIDEGYDRMFDEFEKVKLAIEDIFNPREEGGYDLEV
jgi:hypothetical protein